MGMDISVYFIKSAYTHNGVFHADDVFASALLKMINPKIEIIRVSDVSSLPDTGNELVFDIGGGRFDHHQKNSEVRDNGVPYAAFGLLWREFGHYLLDDPKACQKFDACFVQAIDLTDNGGQSNTLSSAISALNPSWDSDKSADDLFANVAVPLAKTIMESSISRIKSEIRGMRIVNNSLAEMSARNDTICVLPRFVPWMNILPGTNANFVVFPGLRGGWNVQGVPISPGSRELKIKFPASWRGLSNPQLSKVADIESITFCHNAGFMAVCDTRYDAIKAARKAIFEAEV